MDLWQSIPLLLVILPLVSACLCPALPRRGAQVFCGGILALSCLAATIFMPAITSLGASYTYSMGHFPAPWGNELRAGPLESRMSWFFMLVLLLTFLGGLRCLNHDIPEKKTSVFCATLLLIASGLNAQVYTNDLFTAYVFLEITTLAAVSQIASRPGGRPLLSSARYMIMNMVGSSLFLLGVILLYDLTGHLLMSPIQQSVSALVESGQYHTPLTLVVALITVGLGIKSALFPFHAWVSDSYSQGTPMGSAIMAALVSKGYLFLMLKVIYRVIGRENFAATGVDTVLFIFALLGMVLGSILAIRQTDLRRMVAYSSVAQIGYIYMGLSLNTDAGMMAAVFHMIAHAVCKSMLFLTCDGLIAVSPSSRLRDLEGSGFRAPLTGAAFTVGALSMVGFPFLGGFSSKVNFALSAVDLQDPRTFLVLAVLVISTWLHTLYFLRAVITIYRRSPEDTVSKGHLHRGFCYSLSLVMLILLNVTLGVMSQPLINVLRSGLTLFG